jgi:glyoxylase-like metal-dependent hydrolase (beta-lactamase superfamily II)
MIVEHIVVSMFMENTWIVACPESREGVILDPGDEAERIAGLVAKLGVTPQAILNTHAHIDHIGAVAELRERYGIPFLVHEGERENLEQMPLHASLFGLEAPPVPEVDDWVKEGDEFSWGTLRLTALETPGHTAGGVSYVGEGFVIAGDTLFAGSIGRTDLPGGDFPTLRKSIRDKLFTLPGETRVHCGHGPDTTIAAEKQTNPFVGDGANPALFGM